jgi:hypothetical protein
MKWNKIKYGFRSEYGQDGVYFFNDGEEYKILKAPESPSNELFSTFLASSFSFIIVII